jgi:hypothetical protein
MNTHESSLRRARTCFITSTVLFVVFCLLGGGSWGALFPGAWAETLRIVSLLAGIFAWSLMCTAYDLRSKAL